MTKEERINIFLDAHSRWKKLRKANNGSTPEFLPPDLAYIDWLFRVERRKRHMDKNPALWFEHLEEVMDLIRPQKIGRATSRFR